MTAPSLGHGFDRASLARVEAALDGRECRPRRRGDHLDARCPAHEDHNPSLSVDWRDGAVLVCCQAGCDTPAVLEALGLAWGDLWDEPPAERRTDYTYRKPQRRNNAIAQKPTRAKAGEAPAKRGASGERARTVARYTYTDAAGEVVGEVLRLEPKSFRWRRMTADGRWQWGAPKQRPLYRLPAVAEAITAGVEVWLAEGEKDADALTAAGVCGTTNPGGAGKGKWRDDHTAALAGARVVIVADRDETGEAHARAVAAALDGVAESARVVLPAVEHEHADAADHLAAGHRLEEFVPLPPLAPPAPLNEARERRRLTAVPTGEPTHVVNVTRGGPFRWSDGDGADGWPRGLYLERSGEWRHCGDLPYVHARAMFWTGVTYEAKYVLSARADSPTLCVAPEDVDNGKWADQLGVPRSAAIDIVVALATAIRQLAAREEVPSVEGAPTRRDRTASGHLAIPPASVLPRGYGDRAPGVAEEEAAAAWRRVVEVAGRSPLLALVLGASVAAPYVGPLGAQSHWWVLYGDPQRGKTTALAAAGAVWGDPALSEGVVMSWNATGKGLGRALGLLGILPAYLDEAGTAELGRDQWAQLMYQTCQGNSRTLAQARGTGMLRTAPWFGALFVTSNGRLTQDLAVGKFAGLARRIVELEAPFTLTAPDAEAVAVNTETGYGWLGARVIEAVTPEELALLRADAAPTLGPPLEGEAATLAEIVGLAVAGAMTVDRVLGTGSTLTGAATGAARGWLAEHAQPREPDGARLLAALASELASHRPAWPTRAAYDELGRAWSDGGVQESTRAVHGYETKTAGLVDEAVGELYVFTDTWHATADALGVDEASACRWLYDHGLLLVPPERRRTGNWQSRKRLGAGQVNVYRLDLAAVRGDGTAGDDGPDQDDPDTAGPPPTPDATPATEPAGATPAKGGPAAREDWQRAEEPAACVRCGKPTPMRVCGEPRHLGQWCVPAPAENDPSGTEHAPTPAAGSKGPAPAQTPENGAQRPAPAGSRTLTRREAREAALEAARAVMAAGGDAEAMAPKLRVLAALEGGRKDRGGPFAPRKRAEGGGYRYPYWRAPLPPIVDAAYVVGGWAWDRPYDGETVPLDRSGAWGAAAASVDVVHGTFTHTGATDYDGAPGYYQTLVHPWHEKGMPSPLGNAAHGSTVWLPHPTVALLADLDREGRWPGLAITDSWTGEPCRLRDWATGYVGELRAHAIGAYGRDSEQYAAIKRAFGQATSLLRGSLREDEHGNDRRTWACKAARPDWRHAIEAQAAVVLWRRADAARKALPPELAPVGLRNTDELVLPAAALDRPELRDGDRPILEIDPAGISYGSFKVKAS